MKVLIEQLLTGTAGRDGNVDTQMALAISEKFAPWGNKADE